MRIVVAMPPGSVGERFENTLRCRGYDVVRTVEPLSKDGVSRFAADVFICGDRKAVRVVQSAALTPAPHVIAALPRLDERSVAAALAAGAVDLMARGAGTSELVARVELPGRFTTNTEATPHGRLRAVGVWDRVPGLMSDSVASSLGWTPTSMPHNGEMPEASAAIRVTCREDASTVELLVGCSTLNGRALVRSQFGADGPESALPDCLRETANILAGTFKQAVMLEGIGVTLGLPQDCNPKKFAEAEPAWTLEGGGLSLVLGMIPGQGGCRMVQVQELAPGMVLRRDVLLHGGVPFVRAGTALTDRTIEKLGEVLGKASSVSVAEAQLQFADSEALEEDGLVLFEVG